MEAGLAGLHVPLLLGDGVLLLIRTEQVDAYLGFFSQVVVDGYAVLFAVLVGGEDLGIDAEAFQFRTLGVGILDDQHPFGTTGVSVVSDGFHDPCVLPVR